MKDINRSQIERLMANKYPIFPICIPSYKRWDRKANTTLSKIIENCDEEIQRNTYVFVREEQAAAYRESFKTVNIVVLPPVNGLAGTRQYIVDYVTETLKKPYFIDLDDEKEKLLNIAMNRIEGDWEWSKLESLLKEFSADELSVTGFTLAEIESIFEMNAEDAGSIYAPGVEEDDTDAEDYNEEDADYEGEETLDDGAASPMDNTPCTVYLSFSDKEAAENWLASQGIDRKFDRSQNIIVRMEGTEYGTASN